MGMVHIFILKFRHVPYLKKMMTSFTNKNINETKTLLQKYMYKFKALNTRSNQEQIYEVPFLDLIEEKNSTTQPK